jgi:glycosyltransferase involved in cell wall biosynthesis
MNSSLVSVIIPLYNSADFIEQTLESVFSQTYKEYEVICVDNNSKDHTVEVIKGLKDKFNWDILILNEPRQGAPYARNLGLSKSNGNYIQFLDSDDSLVQDKLAIQVAKFESNKELDFITAEHYEIVNGDQKYKKRDFRNSWQGLISSSIGITSSALFKKDCLVKVGGFDTHLVSNQEKELYLKLLKDGSKHMQLTVPLFNKYSHPASISSTVDRKSHVNTKLNFLYKISEFLLSAGMRHQYEKLLNTQYFFLFMNLASKSTVEEIQKMNALNKGDAAFDIWKSDLPLKNRLMVKLFTPVGYSAIFNTIKKLKSA